MVRVFDNRKAELSMNMIVMIVIALIVLAIVAYMIYDKTKAAQASGKCEAQGGLCSADDGKCPPTGPKTRPELTRGSITPCKPEGSDELIGRCCYPE